METKNNKRGRKKERRWKQETGRGWGNWFKPDSLHILVSGRKNNPIISPTIDSAPTIRLGKQYGYLNLVTENQNRPISE